MSSSEFGRPRRDGWHPDAAGHWTGTRTLRDTGLAAGQPPDTGAARQNGPLISLSFPPISRQDIRPPREMKSVSRGDSLGALLPVARKPWHRLGK
jgi:hypothetical protein